MLFKTSPVLIAITSSAPHDHDLKRQHLRCVYTKRFISSFTPWNNKRHVQRASKCNSSGRVICPSLLRLWLIVRTPNWKEGETHVYIENSYFSLVFKNAGVLIILRTRLVSYGICDSFIHNYHHNSVWDMWYFNKDIMDIKVTMLCVTSKHTYISITTEQLF